MGSIYNTYHFFFQTPKATVSRYIITWTIFFYFSLGLIPIWCEQMCKQINEKMPEIFKRMYPSTQCILNCKKLYCQDRPPFPLKACYTLTTEVMSHIKV